MILRSKKNGFPLKSFDGITREHPRLKLNSFSTLRTALMDSEKEHIIGSWLPAIEVAISPDKMTALLYINLSKKEFDENKQPILQQAEKVLTETGISHGKNDLKSEPFKPGEPMIAAVGTLPTKGKEAVVTYIDIPSRRPVIREDGLADYFEMNFVTTVKEGDWLGEKIPAQEGVDGIDVLGNTVSAKRGDDVMLSFDKKSVTEEQEKGKVVLRASHSGALEIINGVIGVGKQLIVNGDVGPETGSITFDGAVTVYGTVLADFSVNATGTISIEGNEGITNAKEIRSTEGDIYIKGGVFGGEMTIVEAQGDIYIKHANNCKLYGKEIHVGLYLLGAEVIADSVFVDKSQGKIIGGEIDALFKIECAFAGNNHERKTTLRTKGIDKDAIYMKVQEMANSLKEHQAIVVKLEQHVLPLERAADDLKGQQAKVFEKLMDTIDYNRKRILEIDGEIHLELRKIKQAIPGQIEVTKEAYPGTIIQIGTKSSTLSVPTNGVFTIIDGVLNV
ncbi:FapA family protein [Sporosarcina sp. JAI121]|uniref:DUF342 domain-containing protein n=1 Tax=Sporosarcina sp. JAI121 TaxID=2723064 RepID=UPI0015CC8F3A|nr:hypothetical protein [Sporosarcina sp. JAI121]